MAAKYTLLAMLMAWTSPAILPYTGSTFDVSYPARDGANRYRLSVFPDGSGIARVKGISPAASIDGVPAFSGRAFVEALNDTGGTIETSYVVPVLPYLDGGLPVTASWNPPTEGSPVVFYRLQLFSHPDAVLLFESQTPDALWLLAEGAIDTSLTYVARVAGVDAQGRQGPWSLNSDPYKQSEAQ